MTKCIRYPEEFKRDAVSQVTDRGYSVKEVSGRLGISTKSLYDWIKLYKKPESVRLLLLSVRKTTMLPQFAFLLTRRVALTS